MAISTIAYTGANSRLEAILDAAIDAIVCIDARGIIDIFNPAAERMFGYNAADVIGKNIKMLMPEPYRSNHDSYLQNYQATGVKKIIGIGRAAVAVRKDGSQFPIDIAVSETSINGKPMYVGFIRDITERKDREQELEKYRERLEILVEDRTKKLEDLNKRLMRQAMVDSLTHIANRRAFDETLAREVKRAARNRSVLSCLFLDIDHFKLFNDTYGHIVGDRCLEMIAGALKNSFKRAYDLPARYGGEEFAVIMPETNGAEAGVLAERLMENIRAMVIAHESSPVSNLVTVSIGIASIQPPAYFDPEELVRAADGALYQAKETGRNRICHADIGSVS
jgi:diguanylate cyclase (GGDEF)-like protein/PAS domain S-box-containing protein